MIPVSASLAIAIFRSRPVSLSRLASTARAPSQPPTMLASASALTTP